MGAVRDVYADAQKTYDSSVRTLAAAGVAVTVSLGTALEKLDGKGTAAVAAFLVSLALNLVSYWTTQRDMQSRLAALRKGDDDGAIENAWTKRTTELNYGAGFALMAGGILLASFVSGAT